MSEMATELQFEEIKSVRQIPIDEYFVGAHRTCQGCESALILKLIAKAAGPRTIWFGATGCMYVANTSYYTTPWSVPWMHTQLGGAGGAGVGAAAALKALMRKGKIKGEKINVISFCGDGGGGDMGLGGLSDALNKSDLNFLLLLYDNESYANTDIQLTGMTPWGALTTFSPSGKVMPITHNRWKKNVAGLMAAGHPKLRYVATGCGSYPIDIMNKTRKALALGGPSFIHTLDPCPKGWHYMPEDSHEMAKLAVETGVWPMYEIIDGKFRLTYVPKKRKPVREYLKRQGRFSHFNEEQVEYFQRKVDEMWEKWLIPGLVPIKQVEAAAPRAS